MIASRDDYRHYVRADLAAHGLRRLTLVDWLRLDHLRFQLRLRRIEYLCNCRRWRVVSRLLLEVVNHRLAVRLGFTVPKNVFGPGLCLAHRGTLTVNPSARVGSNCRLHVGTSIADYGGTPVLGDNVYVGPGAKLFGPITIGSNVAIGANAVVNQSVPDGCTVGGVPAKVISAIGAVEQGVFPNYRLTHEILSQRNG
ncbi:MAG: serine acetyltransferase [Bacteroidales bacterium]|nr:serine acetyltransferase [Bacteroidales bacterium]